MYEALVARVRYHIQKASFMGLKDAESTLLLAEAADAIEEMIAGEKKLLRNISEQETQVEQMRRARKWIPVTERLPKPGEESLVLVSKSGMEVALYEEGFYGEAEWFTTQAVPVPPHGRLIDADALMAEFERAEKTAAEHGREYSFSFMSNGDICTAWYSVQGMLNDAPTIIPAEEGE